MKFLLLYGEILVHIGERTNVKSLYSGPLKFLMGAGKNPFAIGHGLGSDSCHAGVAGSIFLDKNVGSELYLNTIQ